LLIGLVCKDALLSS